MAAPGRPRKCDADIENLWMDIEYHKNNKVISILRKHSIDSTDGNGRTALINSVIKKNQEIFNWCIANNANVNFQDRIGCTALHFAAETNSFEFANILIANDANVNTQDKHGNIPLWKAMFNSQLVMNETTKLLLKHNSNVELNNNYGRSCRSMFNAFFDTDPSGDVSAI